MGAIGAEHPYRTDRQLSQTTGKTRQASERAFALSLLTCQFTGTTDGFGFLTRFLDGGFLEVLPKLHFTKHTLTLKFFLQGAERLIDIVVANADLHMVSPPS
ncbi:hypothetical protein BFP70_16450 [Thioclava sp. SK-1]|nr:hypothetical protein BFP70_16450 [Thioclava sp. SK-1]